MATTLLGLNWLSACAESTAPGGQPNQPTTAPAPTPAGPTKTIPAVRTDGGFAVPMEACEDEVLADLLLGVGQPADSELILDMQTFFVSPTSQSDAHVGIAMLLGPITNERFPWIVRTPGLVGENKYGRSELVQQVLGGPTSIAVVTGLPYRLGDDGTGVAGQALLTVEDLKGGVDYLSLDYPGRLLAQVPVVPNDRIDLQLAAMERHAEWCHSWRSEPAFSLGVEGYRLDEGVGPQMLAKGIELGRPIFSIQKGRGRANHDPAYASPADIGGAARMFPNAHLVVSEAAFDVGFVHPEVSRPPQAPPYAACGTTQLSTTRWPEGPYDDQNPDVQRMFPLDRGVNALIHSLRSHNIGPNGRDLDNPTGPVTTHVYAEVGIAWPELMTSRHEESMHFWGKLLQHIGEDRILWGTGTLFYGSPTPIIQAFRCFEISQAFQTRYGYPALTAARKRKILGLNALRMTWQAEGTNVSRCDDRMVSP